MLSDPTRQSKSPSYRSMNQPHKPRASRGTVEAPSTRMLPSTQKLVDVASEMASYWAFQDEIVSGSGKQSRGGEMRMLRTVVEVLVS